MNELVPVAKTNAEIYRASTDAAGLCREIVLKTAMNIQGRRYVKAEGWLAIAIAHGCVASADHVERVEDDGYKGFRATGIIRRMSDGIEIARAEGFVGDDEPTWAKRPVYARRAMCQTRAISRACRSAFAHVVILIDAGLSTTPAEEVPMGGFENGETIEHAPPRTDARGIKRLSSARAKDIGLDKRIKDLIEACDTVERLDVFELNFDTLTAEAPISWLDSIRNEAVLKREELEKADQYGAEFDRAFAGTVGPKEAVTA